jgi:hypothetical protein
LYAQTVKLAKNELEAVNVSMSIERLGDKEVVKIIMDTAVKKADQPTYVRLKGIEFQNGTIELKVLSRLTRTQALSPGDLSVLPSGSMVTIQNLNPFISVPLTAGPTTS